MAQGGTSALEALRLAPGIRAAALGGAYVADGSDPSAIYFNPAGLARLESGRIEVTHELRYAGVQRELGAAAFVVPGGMLGVSASYLHVPPIAGYDASDIAIGDVTAATSTASLAYGFHLPAAFSTGITATYYAQRLADITTTGIAFSFGGQWQPHDRMTLGAALRNFGPHVQMQTVTEPLPNEIAVGFGWRTPFRGIGVATEVSTPRDGGSRLHMGLEYTSPLGLSLRTGYATSGNALQGSTEGFIVGAGFAVGSGMLDYSYTPGNDFGSVHRFGLAWNVGTPTR